MKTLLVGVLLGILISYLYSIRAKWLPAAKVDLKKIEDKLNPPKAQ